MGMKTRRQRAQGWGRFREQEGAEGMKPYLKEGSVQPTGGVRDRLLRGNIALENNIIWLFLVLKKNTVSSV